MEENLFIKAASVYEEALQQAGYNHKLNKAVVINTIAIAIIIGIIVIVMILSKLIIGK